MDEGKIVIQCPHCGLSYELPGNTIGQNACCESCGTNFVIRHPSTLDAATMRIPEEERSRSSSQAAQVKAKQEQPGTQFQTGQKIGHYQVEKCLGIGGMGEVYLVKNTMLGCYRAMKTLKNTGTFSEDQRERFLREARIASMIQHRSVVGVVEIVTEEESPEHITYIVMEYVDGGSVADILKKQGPIEEKKALQYIRQAAEALEAAQKVQLVHRDIKPDNLMLTKDGEVKLADFGIASSKVNEFDISSTLTMAGSMMGTPAYASPEQCRDSHNTDVRSDIYSLGASLFEMLTGRLPYIGSTPYDIMEKAAHAPIPDPRSLKSNISERAALLTMRMLAKDPAERPQTPEQLILALDVILNEEKMTDPKLMKLFERMIEANNTEQKKAVKTVRNNAIKWTSAVAIIIFTVLFVWAGKSVLAMRKEIAEKQNKATLALKKEKAEKEKEQEEQEKQEKEQQEQEELLRKRIAELESQKNTAQSEKEKELLNKLKMMEEQLKKKTPGVYVSPNKGLSKEQILARDKAKGIRFSDDGTVLIRYNRELPDNIYEVPDFVKKLAPRAFERSENLSRIILPEGLETIGGMTFWGCRGLDKMEIPSTVKAIPGVKPEMGTPVMLLFPLCDRLREIKVSAKWERINLNFFGGPAPYFPLKLSLPDEVEYISYTGLPYLMKRLYLEKLPKNLKELPPGIQVKPETEVIELPAGVKEIPADAFTNMTKLRKVVVQYQPQNGEFFTIQKNAFKNCPQLKEVVLPKNTKIEQTAFDGCPCKTELFAMHEVFIAEQPKESAQTNQTAPAEKQDVTKPEKTPEVSFKNNGSSCTFMLPGNVPLVMQKIPAGSFMMGSPSSEKGRNNSETQHEVVLTQDFWMGKFEVTQAQYEAIMKENPSHFRGDKKPVENVSWSEAMAFCRKLNSLTEGSRPDGYKITLPTEAQWEYACRAGTRTKFYFGNSVNTKQANFDGTSQYRIGSKGIFRKTTTDAGSFPPNRWGLHDMHGNVWEWCLDGKTIYPKGKMTDPVGSLSGQFRAIRGGGWGDCDGGCRSADRYYGTQNRVNIKRNDFGFRIVLVKEQ